MSNEKNGKNEASGGKSSSKSKTKKESSIRKIKKIDNGVFKRKFLKKVETNNSIKIVDSIN